MFCYRSQTAARCPLVLSVQSLFSICLWRFFDHIELLDLGLNICVKGLLPELLPFPNWVLLDTSIGKLDYTSIEFLKINTKSFRMKSLSSMVFDKQKPNQMFLVFSKKQDHLPYRRWLLEVTEQLLQLYYSWSHHPKKRTVE